MAKKLKGVDAILARVHDIHRATVKHLKLELSNIEEKRKELTADLDDAAKRVRRTLGKLLGGKGKPARASQPTTGRRGKRIRRNPEQLKLEADAIYKLIKGKGESGARGGEIRKAHAKVGPNIKGFVEKYGGHKLKTTGRRASMRYFAS